jgi:hypothetical protein
MKKIRVHDLPIMENVDFIRIIIDEKGYKALFRTIKNKPVAYCVPMHFLYQEVEHTIVTKEQENNILDVHIGWKKL